MGLLWFSHASNQWLEWKACWWVQIKSNHWNLVLISFNHDVIPDNCGTMMAQERASWIPQEFISQSAVKTKFEQHTIRAWQIIESVKAIMDAINIYSAEKKWVPKPCLLCNGGSLSKLPKTIIVPIIEPRPEILSVQNHLFFSMIILHKSHCYVKTLLL